MGRHGEPGERTSKSRIGMYSMQIGLQRIIVYERSRAREKEKHFYRCYASPESRIPPHACGLPEHEGFTCRSPNLASVNGDLSCRELECNLTANTASYPSCFANNL